SAYSGSHCSSVSWATSRPKNTRCRPRSAAASRLRATSRPAAWSRASIECSRCAYSPGRELLVRCRSRSSILAANSAGARWASRVVGVGGGLLVDMVVGIIGAFLGRWLFAFFGISLGPGLIPEIIVAFVGASILLLVVRAISGGYRRRPVA